MSNITGFCFLYHRNFLRRQFVIYSEIIVKNCVEKVLKFNQLIINVFK